MYIRKVFAFNGNRSILILGTETSKSPILAIPRVSNSSLPNAVIDIGASCNDSLFFWAVIIISSSTSDSVCWASTGADNSIKPLRMHPRRKHSVIVRRWKTINLVTESLKILEKTKPGVAPVQGNRLWRVFYRCRSKGLAQHSGRCRPIYNAMGRH